MPKEPTRTGDIFRLKTTLQDIEPPIWRRIEVSGDTTMARLHEILQVTMGWQNYHLHEFRVGDVAFGEPDPDFDDRRVVKDDRRARLGGVVAGVGSEFTYEYDFGDGWVHDVVVEAVHPPEPRVRYPRVLGGARACPPEDVGGVAGYADFLAAIGNPRHREHKAMLDWVGSPFDAERFDADATNRAFDVMF